MPSRRIGGLRAVSLSWAGAGGAFRLDAIAWGAQDVSEHASGAFTGEVAAAMLAEFGCRYAIVGHSERRQLYGETDAAVAAKAAAALAAGLTPIVCVGETLAEREAAATDAVVLRQLDAVLPWLGAEARAGSRRVRAGVGDRHRAERPRRQQAAGRARARCARRLRTAVGEAADEMLLLYGGSVKADNAQDAVCDARISTVAWSAARRSRRTNFWRLRVPNTTQRGVATARCRSRWATRNEG